MGTTTIWLWIVTQSVPNGDFGSWEPFFKFKHWDDAPEKDKRRLALLDQIVIENHADGRVEVFVPAYGVIHNRQHTPNGIWLGWDEYLTRDASGNPTDPDLRRIAVARNSDGRLEIFGNSFSEPYGSQLSLGRTFHIRQATVNGNWSNWDPFGDAQGLAEIAVGQNADGRLEVFAIDGQVLGEGRFEESTHFVWRNAQAAPSGAWSGWEVLGDAQGLGKIAVGQNADGRLEVFATDTADGLVWHNDFGWTDWDWMRDAKGLREIAVGRNADGRLEVFAIDTAAGLCWHNWQVAPKGEWSGWEALGDAQGLGKLAVGQNANGRLEVFATDTADGLLWHNRQTNDNWSGWDWLRDIKGLSTVAVGRNANGRLMVIARQYVPDYL